jgi:hypothetical protein
MELLFLMFYREVQIGLNKNSSKALSQNDISIVSVSSIAQSGAAIFKIEDNRGSLYAQRR